MSTCLRALSCAGLLAASAGAHAAITVSFAAGSANIERFFEIRNTSPATSGISEGLIVQTVEGVSVDLLVTNGAGLGLSSGRVGFEAEFLIDVSPATNGGGGVFGLIGPMLGGFRFYDLDNYEDTILGGFIEDGVGVIVGVSLPGPPGGGPTFLSGSLLGPLTYYSTQDFIPIAGFDAFLGDSAFTLTNFLEAFEEGNDTVAFASGSFSGSFIPSTGTGVLSALALGVCATRRRR
ncbi:MAG: hypothetical protein KF684_03565 [Phycisphaeraceae bacterium]|nr:hypothetical protein [Phycisphaeraceae bacterium]